MEAEQVGLALPEKALDPDVVVDGLEGAGEFTVEGDHGVQQPVHGHPLGDEVDAQVAGEKEVGLTRFHRDAGRDAAAVQVPGARMHVVLGHHAPAGHRSRLALQRDDAVHQHERLVRQSYPGREAVGACEGGAQHPLHGTDGEFHAHVTIENGGEGAGVPIRRRSGHGCCRRRLKCPCLGRGCSVLYRLGEDCSCLERDSGR